jgi:predicted transposase/invertase (TIGR01784 family)
LFARFAFGHPERAAAELRAVLPPQLVGQVDWTCLQREPSSVVDPELRERQSDLLFSARLHGGEPVLLYFLLEHQSSVDRWMALRMLRYVLRQLEHWRHQHPDSQVLPVVIPVVMYHEQEGGWTAARRVEELFHLPGEALEHWRALVPRFEYLLDDLTAEREEALRARPGPPLARLAVLLLRSGRSENLALLLDRWRPLLAEVLASPEGHEQLRAVVHYLLRVIGKEAREPLRRVLNSVVSEQGEEGQMKTIADELIEEGWQKGWRDGLAEGEARGLAEGQARGRAEVVLRLLSIRGIAVDERTRAHILSCKDLALLDRWLEQAMNAKSLLELENL